MWLSFLVFGAIVALFLFTRLRRFSIPGPLAFVLSVGVVVLPFVLIPIIAIWIFIRWAGKYYRSRHEAVMIDTVFCPRCGADLPANGVVCRQCGNSVQVSG